tara:strand:+ start:65 stop:214 length:150 start_codon:yes stop_codon:yes gene_type:complete
MEVIPQKDGYFMCDGKMEGFVRKQNYLSTARKSVEEPVAGAQNSKNKKA